MPVVPIEQNKTGIAGVTDAKLQAADLSGTGLQALGGGLQMLGEAGGKVADQQQAREQQQAGQQQQADQQQQQAQDAHSETVKLDALGKMGINSYTAGARDIRDGIGQLKGADAIAALPGAMTQLGAVYDQVHDSMTPAQKSVFGPALSDYLHHDAEEIQGHVARQWGVEQGLQSQLVQQNAADDAVDYAANPALAEKHIETGVDSIRLQAQLRGASPATVEPDIQQYRSGIRLRTIDKGVMGDPLGAAVALARHRAEMTDADVAAAQQSLAAPVREILAIGAVDRYAMGQSPSASSIAPPTAPTRDLSDLAARMRFISGQSGSGEGPDLGALAARYGGDAAKAWAAAQLGPDVVDTAIKAHGDAWLGALPADAQGMVQQNMALLNAAGSPRAAPPATDRDGFSAWLDTQTGDDGEPWTEARKQDALGEFDTRVQLAARRADAAADQAKDAGFALADQLQDGFTSVTQIPPEIRRSLKPEVLAALTRQAAANLRPVPVDPGGRASLMLNLMAAQTPAAFAREDLRVWRDLVSPQEYTRFQALQQGVQTYPPSNEAMALRNVVDQMGLHGLAAGGGEDRNDNSPRFIKTGQMTLQSTQDDDPISPFSKSSAPADENDIVVAATREQAEAAKHGLIWHLGNLIHNRNWDGTVNTADKARTDSALAEERGYEHSGKIVAKGAIKLIDPGAAATDPGSSDNITDFGSSSGGTPEAAAKWAEHVAQNRLAHPDTRDKYEPYSFNNEVKGPEANIFGGYGAPKCNIFVYDALRAGGVAPGLIGGVPPLAESWGNPNRRIDHYRVVKAGEKMQFGDIVSNGDHVGIYTPHIDSKGKWLDLVTSAASANLHRNDAPESGGPVTNNWGFRQEKGPGIIDDGMTVRRFVSPVKQ